MSRARGTDDDGETVETGLLDNGCMSDNLDCVFSRFWTRILGMEGSETE